MRTTTAAALALLAVLVALVGFAAPSAGAGTATALRHLKQEALQPPAQQQQQQAPPQENKEPEQEEEEEAAAAAAADSKQQQQQQPDQQQQQQQKQADQQQQQQGTNQTRQLSATEQYELQQEQKAEQAEKAQEKADAARAATHLAQLEEQREAQEAKDPKGAAEQAQKEQLAQAAKDAADEKKVGLPEELEEFLKPSYQQAVGVPLAVDVPAGLSPVDAAKYRISALRRRLDAVNKARAAVAKARAAGSRRTDEAYLRLEAAGDALHHAYTEHERAARGVDLDHVKGDPKTLRKVQDAADRVLKAQEEHFSLSSDWTTALPLGYDQELSLDNTRVRLQRVIATLEKQLADSISAAAEHEAEKRDANAPHE